MKKNCLKKEIGFEMKVRSTIYEIMPFNTRPGMNSGGHSLIIYIAVTPISID